MLSLLLLAFSLHGPTPNLSTSLNPPSLPGALAPNLTVHHQKAYLTWLEPTDNKNADHPYRLRWSILDPSSPNPKTWSEPKTIIEGVPFFANWADLPSLVINHDESMLAHWLQKSAADPYAYDIHLARSTDHGQSWKTLGPAHFDGINAEHGFVSLVPGKNTARAFWLDGRNMAPADSDSTGHGSGSMTLRTATISDTITDGFLLDDRVCECCDTDAATTSDGPIIVYRDRSMEESRDISIIRYDGHEWTKSKPVHNDNWIIRGCPVNGPAIAARDQLVAVAWFTGAAGQSTVKIAFSQNAGATFNEPITIDNSAPLGRVDVLLTQKGHAIVTWLDKSSQNGSIQACRVTQSGTVTPPTELAPVSLSRSTGFPKITLLGPKIILVWTDATKNPTQLRAILIPLSTLDDSSQ